MVLCIVIFFKVFIESSGAYFYLKLIPSRWYKDEYINLNETGSNEIVISNSNSSHNNTQTILEFTQKYTGNDHSEKYCKQVSRNRLKYGTLMGEAKKAIQFAIQSDDDELIQFIREFNKRKVAQQIQAELIKQ